MFWIGVLAAIGVAAIAALFMIGWLLNRRARAAYIATLSESDKERLRGFEIGRGSWRLFCTLEENDHRRQISEKERLASISKQYNAEIDLAARAFEARPDIRLARTVGILPRRGSSLGSR